MKEAVFVRYTYANGPGHEKQAGKLVTMNCQAWVHFDLQNLGVPLPAWMRSKEIFEDESAFFRTLTLDEPVKRGDVFLFGRQETCDTRYLHLAIHSGYQTRDLCEPILTHVTVVEKTVGAWPLSQFSREPRYEKLFCVKRPITLDF